ncbi:MAG: UDP-N-acetylmuramate--L-alanine ligase [Planctomycetes bacterium]|nr:UDP-N-acetylmuramate--L-alanine ligase [Planctomycetota bacterium]
MRLSLDIFSKSYLVGIGGSGMSNLADLLNSMGCSVRGSDIVSTSITEKLASKGIQVTYEQNGKFVRHDSSIVIVTAAISSDHPEMQKARMFNIPVIKYSRAIGFLMRFKLGVAIAGTHGKTSTSTLLSEIFQNANAKPAFLIGGISKNMKIGGNWSFGRHFIVEACEYDRSFLEFNPHIIGITNIDEDHLDYYHDLQEIEDAFHEFTLESPESGKIFLNADNESCFHIRRFQKAKIFSYGIENDADFKAIITRKIKGSYAFKIKTEEFITDEIIPSMPGLHNVYNSTLAAAIALECSIDFNVIKASIETFQGSKRRFDFLGTYQGVDIYDDYAHHPTELKALIESAKARFEDKTLNIVFQPHQAFRTKTFLNEFGEELAKADKIILTSIFAAREEKEGENSLLMSQLLNEIQKHNLNVTFMNDSSDVLDYLSQNLSKNDVLFTVGAGNVYLIGEKLVSIDSSQTQAA